MAFAGCGRQCQQLAGERRGNSGHRAESITECCICEICLRCERGQLSLAYRTTLTRTAEAWRHRRQYCFQARMRRIAAILVGVRGCARLVRPALGVARDRVVASAAHGRIQFRARRRRSRPGGAARRCSATELFATGLLRADGGRHAGELCAAAGLRRRAVLQAAGQGRLRRRHRRLVRGHRAVPPSARPADPAHRHHSGAEGAARRRRSGRFVGQPRVHRGEVRRLLGQLDLAGIVARFFADPAATRPAAEALAGMLPQAAGHASRTAAPAARWRG